MTTLVLTVIGDDRAGLVDTLASPIAAHQGSWQRSHLARLAGKFAGIVVVDVPDDQVGALVADIEAITSRGLLDARVAIAGTDDQARGSQELHVQLVGQDRPGIVHEIARALAARGVSIDELETRTESASMSGEHLFHAAASLRVPDDADPGDVQDALEQLGDEMMVDLDVATRPQVP
ncbi:MAG: ACT domain-containing protein [Actinomycetota bacterium]